MGRSNELRLDGSNARAFVDGVDDVDALRGAWHETDARAVLSRQTQLLSAVGPLLARVHAAASADAAAGTAVRAASIVLGARVSLELTTGGRAVVAEHDPFAPSDEPFAPPLVLAWDEEPSGELRCERRSPPFDRVEGLVLAQIARAATSAVQKHALARHADEREDAAAIAHDLRARLQTLTFGLDALAGQPVATPLSRTLRQAWALLDDLGDIVADPSASMRTASVSARGVLCELADRISPLASQRHLEVRVDLPPADFDVVADRRRLLHALACLGAVAIDRAVTRVTLGAVAQRFGARFDVTDDGFDLDPSALRAMFDLEDRDPRTRTLRTVRRIANAHGGAVGAEPSEGQGTRCWIRLPVR